MAVKSWCGKSGDIAGIWKRKTSFGLIRSDSFVFNSVVCWSKMRRTSQILVRTISPAAVNYKVIKKRNTEVRLLVCVVDSSSKSGGRRKIACLARIGQKMLNSNFVYAKQEENGEGGSEGKKGMPDQIYFKFSSCFSAILALVFHVLSENLVGKGQREADGRSLQGLHILCVRERRFRKKKKRLAGSILIGLALNDPSFQLSLYVRMYVCMYTYRGRWPLNRGADIDFQCVSFLSWQSSSSFYFPPYTSLSLSA